MKTIIAAVIAIVACTVIMPQDDPPVTKPRLTSLAMRVHHMDKMVAFYSEAFGVRFREVETSGLRSQFGTVNGVLLKLVPLRKSADFENFPLHQPGFEVADIQRVIDIATKHGGRQQSRITRTQTRLHAAVRDPDGNTVELYQPLSKDEATGKRGGHEPPREGHSDAWE